MSKISIPKEHKLEWVQTITSVSSKNYHFSKVTSTTNEENDYPETAFWYKNLLTHFKRTLT